VMARPQAQEEDMTLRARSAGGWSAVDYACAAPGLNDAIKMRMLQGRPERGMCGARGLDA
jgi:hypothetical protein